MSLKKLFRILLGIQVALGVGLAILTLLLFLNQRDLSRSQRIHFDSYLLADELRQSSDDLTRTARVYVATGNEEFERQYWTVLGVRNGNIPRPLNYNRIYWDFAAERGQKPRPSGESISLHDLMVKQGITEAELQKLSLAQKYSDELVNTEKIAMSAVKGLFDDGMGNFTVKKQPDRELAIRLMNDDAYHTNKVNIMRPIDEFYAMLEERTNRDIAMYEQRSMNLLFSLGVLILVIMGMFGFSFVTVQRQITIRNQAERTLRESEQKTSLLANEQRIILNCMPIGVSFIRDRTIQYCNPAFDSMFGYELGTTKGMNTSVFYSNSETYERVGKEAYAAIANGGVYTIETAMKKKDGSQFFCSIVGQAINAGKPEDGAIWLLQDITERNRAELDLSKLRQAIDTSGEAIFLTDRDGIFTYVNPGFVSLYGFTVDEIVGKKTPRILKSGLLAEGIFEQFWKTISSGREMRGEFLNKRKDGRLVEIDGSASPIFDEKQHIVGYLGIQRDITERKRTEVERQVMYEISQGVATSANLGELLKLIHQSLQKVLYAENCFVALHDQKTGLFSFPYFVDKFDSTPQPAAMTKSCTGYVFRTGEPTLITQTVFNQLQEQHLVELVGSPSPSWIGVPLQTPSKTIGVLVLQHYELENMYSEGDLRFLASVGSQIALVLERKQAEDALRDSETKLNVILESTADGILAVDRNGNVIRTNKRFAELWRLPQSLVDSGDDVGLLNHVVSQLVDPEGFLSKVRILYNSADEDRDTLHFKDGRVFERYSAPIILGGDTVGRVWSFRDVTERKRAEDALRESGERYRSLFDDSPIAIWEEDFSDVHHHFEILRRSGVSDFRAHWNNHPDEIQRLAGIVKIVMINNASARIIGAEQKEQVLASLHQYFTVESIKVFEEEMIALASGKTRFQSEISLRNVIGETVIFDLYLAVQPGFEHDLSRVLVSFVDITDRKRMEGALRESENRMRLLVEGTPYLFFYTQDTEARITYISPSVEKITGRSVDEWNHQKHWFITGNIINEYAKERTRAHLRGEFTTGSIFVEVEHADKRPILLEVYENPIIQKGKVVGLQGVAYDITERKRTEESLRHSQKLESIGTLAGGIAHDFNNLLNAMIGQSDLAIRKLPKESPARNHIDKSIKAAERAADLTRQLLAYSGKGKFVTEEIVLNRLVDENIQMLETSVPKTVQLRFELGSPSLRILGDVGQIQQIVMNLIINAGEAMGFNPGSINVRTSCMALTQDDTEYWKYTATPLAPGRYAVLQISDNGCGMSQETLSRIFDPFFTTKFTGRGLGLAAVLGIIRGHHGGVRIKSEEGNGTQFEVVFPIVESDEAPEAREAQYAGVIDGSGKTVLVIDDEPSVLELLTDIFTDAKFTVIGASNPMEGIELYRQHREQIAAVILDYSMPGMDGKAAFEEFLKINNAVKVLLCSGYTEEEMAAAFGIMRPSGFIHKPYKPATLLEQVSRVLSG